MEEQHFIKQLPTEDRRQRGAHRAFGGTDPLQRSSALLDRTDDALGVDYPGL